MAREVADDVGKPFSGRPRLEDIGFLEPVVVTDVEGSRREKESGGTTHGFPSRPKSFAKAVSRPSKSEACVLALR